MKNIIVYGIAVFLIFASIVTAQKTRELRTIEGNKAAA